MTESIKLKIDQLVKRFWFFLCTAPVLLQMAFHIMNNDKLERAHIDAVLLMMLAFASLITIVWRHNYFGRLLPWVIAAITIFVSISVCLQSDRNLSWPGSDVAINNFNAALIAIDEGPVELISTWNARANPYVEPNYLHNPQELQTRINTLGLDWLVGSRWDRRDLPQNNNRMHMHPPGGPVVLGIWLKLFGKSHLSATVYSLFIRYCLIVAAIFWMWRYIPANETLNRIAIALLLATVPRMLSVIIPHPNELATLLAVGAVMIATGQSTNQKFIAYVLSGMLLALAGYINFCYIIVGFTIAGALILSKEAWQEKLPIAFVIGESIVIIAFMILGYYPWLTFLTGTQVTYYYNLKHNINLLIAGASFVAISIPLLLVTFLSFSRLTKRSASVSHIWMAGCIVALFVYSYVIFPNPPSRYLVGIFFLLIPLLTLTIRELQLSVYQVMMIPVINFIYMVQGLFFIPA